VKKEDRRKPGAEESPVIGLQERIARYPWVHVLLAALPLALAAWYLTAVAPGLIPLPPGIDVPFPRVTGALCEACTWCGENQPYVWGGAGALLLAGVLFRLSRIRYYAVLALVSSLALGFTWYSISAPVDRLIRSVEAQLPKDERVPPAPSSQRHDDDR